MPKEKYDWPAIKQEYFESEDLEIKTFMWKKYGKNTGAHGWFAKHTKGWHLEKRAISKRVAEEALRRAEEEEIEFKKNCLKRIVKGFATHVENKKALRALTPHEKKVVWEVFRTENGMPTKIQVNTNLNTHKFEDLASLLDNDDDDDDTGSKKTTAEKTDKG